MGEEKNRPGERKERTLFIVLRAILGIAAVLAVLNAGWLAVFYAARALFGAFAGAPAFPASLLAVFSAGLVLVGSVGSLFSRFVERDRKNYFSELADALGRLAKGDYSVRIDLPFGKRRHPLRSIVDTFNRTTEALARMEDVRREFISDVSHEIQSPLTSIRGFAAALRDPSLPRDKAERYLGIIESESDRLSRLAGGLLRLRALENQVPAPREFRLDAQLRAVVVAAEPQWRSHEIEVNLDLPRVLLRGDEEMLGQVWTNLLHNAVKFTPPGGSIAIELDPGAGSGAVRVSVSDTGAGLSEEDAIRVFDRFYKADRARTAGAGGSGLGLAIARRIIRLHGGEIEAASEGPGRGSRFTVTLPGAGVRSTREEEK